MAQEYQYAAFPVELRAAQAGCPARRGDLSRLTRNS
jgi:hypothetical protein